MLKSTKLLSSNTFKAPIAEAYKTLRTNIQFASIDKPIQVLLMTSSGPMEGKSTTSSNLAISVAQTDKRVLLVDCDLRKPSLHRAFNILNVKGLTNILAEGVDYKLLSNTAGVPNLDIITSGPKPPNPSELLGTDRMKTFIEKVRGDYDMVILDAPPLLPVTDAAVLSNVADGVILVIGHGSTTQDMAMKAKENLVKVGANIIGTVINDIPVRDHGYNYYYYSYYDVGDDNSTRRKPKLHDKSARMAEKRESK